jgi:membrane protein implicated in regulation of membrane protease activity
MRTLLFLVVGFLLLVACMLLGRLFSSNYPGATYAATLTFVVLWLVISTANLWVGVARAGYTLPRSSRYSYSFSVCRPLRPYF